MTVPIHDTVGLTTLIVIGATTPPDDAWGALVDRLAQHPGKALRLLVLSHGGSPNPQQRKALVERVLKQRPVVAAMVTDSREARGAAAAMSWFLDTVIECFLPHEAGRALAYLDVPEPRAVLEAAAAREAALGLARRLLETRRVDRTTPYVPES